MAIRSDTVKEKKEEAKIVELVNKLAPSMEDKDEASALRDLIGKNKETWRVKSTIWFEDSMRIDFRKLRDFFRKEGYDAKIAYDQESESWALYIGKDAKGIKEKAAPATSPFKEEATSPDLEEIKKKLKKAMERPAPIVAAPVEEKPKKPKAKPKPKRFTRKERKIMKLLDSVLEQSKEIHKSQYKVGRDYLEKFIADYAKLQKLFEGKKNISAYTRDYAKVRLMAANVAFWTRYAERRLAPPKPKKLKKEAIEIPLRETAPLVQKGKPSEEGMEWISKQYKRKTGIGYDKNRDMYVALKKSYDSAENLASQLRFAQQLADNTYASYKALFSMQKAFKKKFPKEAKVFDAFLARVYSASKAATNASKPTLEGLHAWAGESPVAEAYLDANSAAINKMLETVKGAELAKVLEYVDAAVKSELEGTKNPRPRPRIVLAKGADFRAVRDGLAVLYAAKGLQKPLMKRTKAVRKKLRGKYILVDTSAPELFVKPDTKNILPPADKDGNVFIKYKGRKIYLHPGQKEVIERSLLDGSIGYIEVTKFGKKTTQVDAAGADLLVQYLREKGWTNLETTEWILGRARAGVRTLEVPAGYWDRPVAKRVIKEVAPEKARAKKVGTRIDDELLRTGTFVIKEPKSKRFGRILDKPGVKGDFIGAFEVQKQKEQLEAVVNTPGARGVIYFENAGVAMNAAELLRAELLGRNDLRTVSYKLVEDYKPKSPRVPRGAYLVVGELSENAFAERADTPLVVPSAYEGEAVLASSADRATLQDFINGKITDEAITFRAGGRNKEALASYLARIGYPPEKVAYSELIKAEVEMLPDEEQLLLEGGVWEITLSSVPMPVSAAEKAKSTARRGIKGGGELQKGRATEYYGSAAYRISLMKWYEGSEVWLKERLEAKAKAEAKKAGVDVSHNLQVSSDVYRTYSQDYRRMDEDQRAYTVIAAGAQGFAYMVLGKDKARLFWQNQIARNHLKLSHIEDTPAGARFAESVQAEVLEHMLYMHSGPGHMRRTDKIYYPERSAQMLATLSKYKTIDDWADAVGNDYASAAVFDGAAQLTNEALALDLDFMMMPPSEQAKKWEATFDLMWRAYAAVVGFETGSRPSANPEPRQLELCATALADYFAGSGENNHFTITDPKTKQEISYKTIEAVVVRWNKKNVLAVPYIDEQGNIDPKQMYIVGERVRRTAPEGYVYYEKVLKPMDDWFRVSTKRSWADSNGGPGLTYRYAWGTNPPELEITEEPIPEPFKLFSPEPYAPSGYRTVANDVYWEKLGISFVKDPANPGQTAEQRAKAVLSEVAGVLHLSTISGEITEGETNFFIHPPRTRFSENGREIPVDVNYPTGKTYAYSSAYIDFNNTAVDVPVYAFRKAGKSMDSPKFTPEDARTYADMGEAKRKKKGIFRIRIGTYNRITRKIEFRNDERKEQFGRHVMGSWAGNTEDLRPMTDEEKADMVPKGLDPNRFYYVIESSHTSVPPKTSMEVGSAEDIGALGQLGTKAKVFLGTNVPYMVEEIEVKPEGKKKKKKR